MYNMAFFCLFCFLARFLFTSKFLHKKTITVPHVFPRVGVVGVSQHLDPSLREERMDTQREEKADARTAKGQGETRIKLQKC